MLRDCLPTDCSDVGIGRPCWRCEACGQHTFRSEDHERDTEHRRVVNLHAKAREGYVALNGLIGIPNVRDPEQWITVEEALFRVDERLAKKGRLAPGWIALRTRAEAARLVRDSLIPYWDAEVTLGKEVTRETAIADFAWIPEMLLRLQSYLPSSAVTLGDLERVSRPAQPSWRAFAQLDRLAYRADVKFLPRPQIPIGSLYRDTITAETMIYTEDPQTGKRRWLPFKP